MMAIDNVRCVVPSGDLCGEGLIWSAEEEALYWTDINRFLIHRHVLCAGTTRSWFFDEPVVALSLSTEPGRVLVALASKLIWWWPDNDIRREHGFVLPGAPQVRLNDGRADPKGNFWVGSMMNNVAPDGEHIEVEGDVGKLFRVAPDGTVTTWAQGLGIPNTLCWSPDGSFFYTGDTRANMLYRFTYDLRSGSISGKREWFYDHPLGYPDGSAMDADGHLWNCRFFGGRVVRISPDGCVGKLIDMPISNPTTAAFGGKDLKTLYITSASILKGSGERLAGSLWAVEVDVPGLPVAKVRVAAESGN